MQLFILGKTKTGKSTLANILNNLGYATYEAGSWARKEFELINHGSKDEFSNEFKNNLTNFALLKLKEDPYYSCKKYEEFLINNNQSKKMIIGVRNPDDFLQMLRMDKENIVIFIKSKKKFQGSLELFEEGLKIIENYIKWKEKIGSLLHMIEINEEDINNQSLMIEILKGKL